MVLRQNLVHIIIWYDTLIHLASNLSPKLCRNHSLLARKIWAVTLELNIRLVTEYVGSERIIRSGADLLSREKVDDVTRLKPDKFQQLLHRFRVRPAVDLFAAAGHNQGGLPYFSRRIMNPGEALCRGCDALAAVWEGVCYAFPPIHLAGPTVEKALAELQRECEAVLMVLPKLTDRYWWPMIADLPHEPIVPDADFLRPVEKELLNQEYVAVLLRK